MNEEIETVLLHAIEGKYVELKRYPNQSNDSVLISKEDLPKNENYIVLKGKKKSFDELLTNPQNIRVLDPSMFENHVLKNGLFTIEDTNDERIIFALKNSKNNDETEKKTESSGKEEAAQKDEVLFSINPKFDPQKENFSRENELKAFQDILLILNSAHEEFVGVKLKLKNEQCLHDVTPGLESVEEIKNKEQDVTEKKQENKEQTTPVEPSKDDLNIDSIRIKAENVKNDIIQVRGDLDALDKNDAQRIEKLQLLDQRANGIHVDMVDLKNIVSERINELEKVKKEQTEEIQIILLRKGDRYTELFTRTQAQGFMNEHDFNEYLKQVVKEFPESEISAAKLNRQRYESLNKLEPTYEQKLNALLKEKECIQFTGKVPHETHKKAEGPKNVDLKKTHEKLERLGRERSRNIFEGAVNYFKILYYSSGMFFKSLLGNFANGAKEARQEKETKSRIKEDRMQIIAMQLPDGSFQELKTERNKQFFLHENELKSYAENRKEEMSQSKFYLVEIPKSEYPSIGKFLTKGIMTDENKEKFQETKNKFLKKIVSGASASYELNRPRATDVESSGEEKAKFKKKENKNKKVEVREVKHEPRKRKNKKRNGK